jgi:hypothetical protein
VVGKEPRAALVEHHLDGFPAGTRATPPTGPTS